MSLEALTWQKDWMATFTGHAVYPLDLKPEDIRLNDIAHSLSQQARYNGHCRFPYWVAQHCVYISRALERDGYDNYVQRVGLLHDASECYTGDMTRPMKNSLKKKLTEHGADAGLFKEIEADVQKVIAKRFGLTFPWHQAVEEYDTRITQDEKKQLFVVQDTVWTIPLPPLSITITEWPWADAKREYLNRARELGID